MEWLALGVALLTGLIGMGGALARDTATGEKAQTAADNVEDQKNRDLAIMDLQYEIATEEANKNAANLDKDTTIREKGINDQINNEIDALLLGQETDALNMNMANMGIDKTEADALTMSAASGTRTGGSNAEAIELQKALNEAELQLNEDSRRNQTNYQLDSILGNLEMNKHGIQQNRDSANDLRSSFEEGGSQKRLYNLQKDNVEKGYEVRKQEYETMAQEATDGWGMTFNALGGFFGGFNSGLPFVGNVMDAWNRDYRFPNGKPKYDDVGGVN